MTDIAEFARLVPLDHGLCVVSTSRRDGTVQASVVNAGVLAHPVSGDAVAGFVARGDSHKVANLRVRPRASVVVRAEWQWAAVEGRTEVIGPDGGDDLRILLRSVFIAAGGTHDDWPQYDRVMAEERRVAVLVTPERVYSNG